MAGGYRRDDALFDRLLGQLPRRPMRDRAPVVLRHLAGDGQDLAPLLRGDGRWGSWPLRLCKALEKAGTRSLVPISPPQSYGRPTRLQASSHGPGVESFGQGQNDPSAMGDPLLGFARSDQAEQLLAFLIRDPKFGWFASGHDRLLCVLRIVPFYRLAIPYTRDSHFSRAVLVRRRGYGNLPPSRRWSISRPTSYWGLRSSLISSSRP